MRREGMPLRLPARVRVLDHSLVARGGGEIVLPERLRREAEPVGEQRHGELGVVRRAVVALAVVLHRQLPVAVLDDVDLLRDARVAQIVRREIGLHLGRHVVDIGGRIVGEADEEKPGDGAQRDRMQTAAARVEAFAHVIGEQQAAIERVGPGVIAADEIADLARARPARAARRDGGRHCGRRAPAVIVAQDQDRRLADAERQHVARLGDIRLLPDEDPVLAEDHRHVGTEHGRRRCRTAPPACARGGGGAAGSRCRTSSPPRRLLTPEQVRPARRVPTASPWR